MTTKASQPSGGAPKGTDLEEDVIIAAKSAEDRKAAVAMAKLDAAHHDDSGSTTKEVDQEAMNKAMGALAGRQSEKKKEVKKSVKLNPADLDFVMNELDMSKSKATELLKAHAGNLDDAIETVLENPFKNFH